MKTKFISLFLLAFTIFLNAQVGINTETPSTTLQIEGKSVGTKVEGMLIPRFTGDEIFNMPISVAQGYTATSTKNNANLVFATSAASVANQTGRGKYLKESGFFYWDDKDQVWLRLFVSRSSSGGNDGVVKINSGAGGAKPSYTITKASNGFGTRQLISFTTPLVFAAFPTTSWPESVGPVGTDAVMTPKIYTSSNSKFMENPIYGQVHIWRLVVSVDAGVGSSGAVMAVLRNPDSLFEINSIQVLPGGSNSYGGNILTFYFYTIADSNSIGTTEGTNDPAKGYQFYLATDVNNLAVVVESLTRVSLFKD